MKNLKYFFGALAMSAVVFTSCDKKGGDVPVIKGEQMPEVAAVPGKVVLVLNCVDNAQVCNPLVFAGNYNGWSTNPAEMATFTAIAEFDGWYKVEITPDATAATETSILEGKPNQLAKDGSFPSSWDHQWFPILKDNGTADKECEIIKGSASLKGEYSGEQSLIVAPGADVVYLRAHAWKKNPCVEAPKYEITFNVTVPAGLPETAVVYVVGDINGWTADGNPMTKGANNTWTTKVANVELNADYKYVVNGNWDYEELAATVDTCANAITNRKILDREMNDVVKNFRGITAERCP